MIRALAGNWITVTNSYHGALWSRRLGNHALIVDKFTDKFSCIPYVRGNIFQRTTLKSATKEAVNELAIFIREHLGRSN